MRWHGAVAAGLAVVSSSLPAAAGDRPEVGWWTRSPAATAPEGGAVVASGPDGPVSVSALRTASGDRVSSAWFEAVEVGGVATDRATISVCIVGAEWEPAAGGALEDAPATTCADGVEAERNPSSLTWTADLTALVASAGDGVLSVALVPGPAVDLLPAGFEVRLATPRLEVEAAASAGGAAAPPRTTPTTSAATVEPGAVAAPPSGDAVAVTAAPPGRDSTETASAPSPAPVGDDLTAMPGHTARSGNDNSAGGSATFVIVALSLISGAATVAGRKVARRAGLRGLIRS